MKLWLSNTFLGIPIFVWILQLLYVAIALLILFFIYSKTSKTNLVLYVLAMIIIDIIWRLAITNKL